MYMSCMCAHMQIEVDEWKKLNKPSPGVKKKCHLQKNNQVQMQKREQVIQDKKESGITISEKRLKQPDCKY